MMGRRLGVSGGTPRGAALPAPPPVPPPALLPMRARQSLGDARGTTGLAAGPARQEAGVTVRAGASPARPGGPYRFTAVLGNRDVGQVEVDLAGRAEITIHDLAVAPPFRGAGLGAALVGAALRFGARAGRSRAWLEADDDGSGRLVRWYRSLGFTPIGTSPRGNPTLQADIRRALLLGRRA
jgi:ribosomal protein S18 acetylase RimI-like enzyme